LRDPTNKQCENITSLAEVTSIFLTTFAVYTAVQNYTTTHYTKLHMTESKQMILRACFTEHSVVEDVGWNIGQRRTTHDPDELGACHLQGPSAPQDVYRLRAAHVRKLSLYNKFNK